MKVAPVSADLLIKLGLIAAAGLGVLYLVNKVTGAAGAAFGDIGDTVGSWASDAAARAWNGSPTAAADYAASVQQATSNPGILPNYAISPYDLIPAGYRMNEYGDLVKMNTGVTGTW